MAIQVAKDRRTRMIFAHMVPKRGLASMHGAEEMIKDIAKLGYKEVILKSDNEAALRSVQEEVKKRRDDPTILENSPVGDSRANGAAERAVQAVGEQVRVLRKALEDRVGYRLSGTHPVLAWLIEHSADVLSKFLVGDDGKTAYERLKGKKYEKELVEFGERVHYRFEKRGGVRTTNWKSNGGREFLRDEVEDGGNDCWQCRGHSQGQHDQKGRRAQEVGRGGTQVDQRLAVKVEPGGP